MIVNRVSTDVVKGVSLRSKNVRVDRGRREVTLNAKLALSAALVHRIVLRQPSQQDKVANIFGFVNRDRYRWANNQCTPVAVQQF